MRTRTQAGRLGIAVAAAVLAATVAASGANAGSAGGGSYDIGSLATPFLQSKTQITILGQDDQAAPSCQSKHFVKASPAEEPAFHAIGTVTEKKWREMWTLDRCGSQVNYWVFFTEVGQGGAYYAIVGP